jgi:hypothetical protein
MSWLGKLFGKRDVAEDILNPLGDKQLREFAVVEDDPAYTKHYFRFGSARGEIESFIVVYRRMDRQLTYLRTQAELPGVWVGFQTLNEHGPWSITISSLIQLGERLAPQTRPTPGHLAANVSAGVLTASAAATPPRSSDDPRDMKLSKRVDAGSWQVARQDGSMDGPPPRDELSRTYRFFNSSTPAPSASLRITLTLEADAGDSTSKGIALNRRLRFYLTPFRLPHEAPFVMRLILPDKRMTYEVLGAPLDAGSDTAVFARFGGMNDVASIIDLLSAGREIRFVLEDDTEGLVQFGLPNDGTFKRLYEESATRLANKQAGYAVLRSQITQTEPTFSELADMVRKSPKDYAIWMVETEPGEFSVLLVLLDSTGKNMDDAWKLQKFDNRREQGAYGLDVARDLRIPLSDVVKSS